MSAWSAVTLLPTRVAHMRALRTCIAVSVLAGMAAALVAQQFQGSRSRAGAYWGAGAAAGPSEEPAKRSDNQDPNVISQSDPASDDAPGRMHHFLLANQPPPGRERGKESKVVARPANAIPRVPDGFTVELLAEGLKGPRAVRVSSRGDIFIANSKANEVRVLRANRTNPASEADVFLSGLNKPFGIAVYPMKGEPEWVYIANTDSVVRVPYDTRDAATKPQVLIDKLPSVHHWTKDIAISPEGDRLILAIGSGSNVAQDMSPKPREDGGLDAWKAQKPLGAAWDTEDGRAQIRSYDIMGGDERVLATGLRNPAGIAFNPNSAELWTVVIERDGLGDDMPYEYVTRVHEGDFFGWPWFYPGPFADPRVHSSRPDLLERVAKPDLFMQAHTAPLQIAFYDQAAFPASYHGDAFVAMHGSWNRQALAGYKVVRLNFDHAGQPNGTYSDFMTGFAISESDVWGRPVGVAVAPDGSLIVTEDGSGTVGRVRYIGENKRP